MANRRIARYAILLCLLIASTEFVVRGPLRILRLGDFTDFSGMYVAARRWIAGDNPYESSQFKSTWLAAGGPSFQGNRGSEANLRPAYPPSSIPLLAPFALFRWTAARNLFLLSALVLFPLMLRATMRLKGVHWNSPTGLLVSAFALALAPWQAAIAAQSISAQAIELAIVGAALQSQTAGGISTGIAFCLKPQLAVWFLLFEVAKKRWRRVLTAGTIFGCMSLLALSRMPATWLGSYRDNLRYFFAIGGVNDFTTGDPVRFELLNPQVMFYYLTMNYDLANVLTWLITACLLVVWARRRWQSDSLRLAAIILIGLLPVYQRIYNAGVIVVVLPYALSHWAETRSKLLVATCGVFLIPGTAILQLLHRTHYIDDAIWNGSWWFNLLIGPHATWAILAMIVSLLFWREKSYLVR